MQTLPNADRAFVGPNKLAGYSLDSNHPSGKHKARVFASALGLTADDADWLRDEILSAAVTTEARNAGEVPFGHRYVVDFPLSTEAGTALVRTSWIVRRTETFPRLTSCYIP